MVSREKNVQPLLDLGQFGQERRACLVVSGRRCSLTDISIGRTLCLVPVFELQLLASHSQSLRRGGDTHRGPDEVILTEGMEDIGIQGVANVLHPIRTVLCNNRAPKWFWEVCFSRRRHDAPIPVGNAEN